MQVVTFRKEIAKKQAISLLLELGYTYTISNDVEVNYKKAIETYDTLLSKFKPDRASTTDAYYNRGLVYQNLEKYDEAIEDYTKAIHLDPDFALAYNNRGVVYHNLEKYDEAIEDYTEAIRLDPDLALAQNNLKSLQK